MSDSTHILNHVAILCRSVDHVAERLARAGFRVSSKETWEGEGTAEIYVGPQDSQSLLLLMEPVKDGAYQRAMEKRGPGLHHIAIDVPHLESFLEDISSSGWLLHPKSIRSLQHNHTLWLARPGFPALIEVQSRQGHEGRLSWPKFISRLSLPMVPDLNAKKLLKVLQVSEIQTTDASSEVSLMIEGTEFRLQDLGV